MAATTTRKPAATPAVPADRHELHRLCLDIEAALCTRDKCTKAQQARRLEEICHYGHRAQVDMVLCAARGELGELALAAYHSNHSNPSRTK